MMILTTIIIRFCLFSLLYAFQLKALKTTCPNQSINPSTQSQMAHGQCRNRWPMQPISMRITPASSIYLRYFFISLLFFVFRVHTDGNRTIVKQFYLHISAEFTRGYRFAYRC